MTTKILIGLNIEIYQRNDFVNIFMFYIQQLFAYTKFKSRKATIEINQRKEVMNDKFFR